MKPFLDCLQDKVLIGDGCWEWTGAKNSKGYGNLQSGGKPKKAHREVYELLVGPIPQGLELDHLCRNPSCVRPDHLEPVTREENLARGMPNVAARNRVKTRCPQGHPYDGYRGADRICLTCQRAAEARWRERKKAASG